jgi:GAF domain-containing protein
MQPCDALGPFASTRYDTPPAASGKSMRGHSKAGSVKSRRRKPAAPKRPGGTAAARPRSASAASQESEVAHLVRERDEALEQLSAASDVLNVISSSPGDLQPVFDAILEHATRICEARFGNLFLYDQDSFRTVAMHNAPPAYAKARMQGAIRPAPDTALGRIRRTRQVVQVADVSVEPGYIRRDPMFVAGVELAGMRTLLAVPMLREDALVGSINIYRQQVRPFTKEQIELLKNFSAQAVIAIENARLLNELRQRNTDLTDALERQTATSNVLQIVSSSPGNLEPVFATILENAVRLCDGKFGSINRWDGEALHLVATYNVPPAFAEFRSRTPFHPGPENPISQMLMTKKVIHFNDLAAEQGYLQRNPIFVAAVELGGVRSFLAVPMLKGNELIGVVIVYRQEVRSFNDKQIELVKNFAAQAVIAIENARLLNELRQRTTDLGESLEQQTATSDVLKIISSSPGELEPVFRAILENATRICEAKIGILFRFEEGAYRAFATLGVTPEYNEYLSRGPIRAGPGTGLGRVAAGKQTVHVIDTQAEQTYADREPLRVATAELGGARTLLNVPMLKEGELIGAIGIYRQEVRPFTEKQVELVTNFAAQAVIAIENARLLDELRQRTEEVVKLNQQLEQRVADQVGEIERMSRLRRFLPPQVADLIVASGAEKQLESHRRDITALFCDLRGFTGFSESSDPEDVMALLAEYHAAIGEIIIKYNGTLERYAGDGVMVIFNDPVPVENPALQAVLMALDMRTAIEALMEKWRLLGHDIGFGIGIAHGYATLGTIGFESRYDYAAIGTVSNVASRLCDEAKPGQILISPRVLLAVDKATKVEPVGEFNLKGIRRPMAAYNVLSAIEPKKQN